MTAKVHVLYHHYLTSEEKYAQLMQDGAEYGGLFSVYPNSPRGPLTKDAKEVIRFAGLASATSFCVALGGMHAITRFGIPEFRIMGAVLTINGFTISALGIRLMKQLWKNPELRVQLKAQVE